MISVIIPVYNAEKKIVAIINQVNNLSVEKEIIVINDCSFDDTESILRGLAIQGLKVIHHVSNRGQAAAVRTGLENSTSEFIFIQDLNSVYGLDECAKLLETINHSGADIVLGSRFTKRRLGSFCLSILFGVKLNDWFSRCQLIRRESLLKLLPDLTRANFAFEILTKAVRKKMRVIEVPIVYG